VSDPQPSPPAAASAPAMPVLAAAPPVPLSATPSAVGSAVPVPSRAPRVRQRRPALPRLLLAVIVGLAIWLVVDGTWFAPTDPEARDLAGLGSLLLIILFVGAALLGRRLRTGEVVRGVFGWAVVFLLVASAYSYRGELASVGGRLLSAFAPGVPIAGRLVGDSEAASVVVIRGRSGQFAVRARIDGVPLTMLVDTGASFVTLTLADAAGVGIDVAGLGFTIPIRTANGVIRAAPVTIDRLLVGTIERQRVSALVAPPDSLTESLLGMSFLETLGGYSISGDQLRLSD
jgi:aspartyl protease family protein